MTILVTGGCGFLVQAILKKLQEQGHPLRSYSRGDYPFLKQMGIEHKRGDLEDPSSLLEAMKGCDRVFHVGAKAGIWGKYEDFYRSNVLGTENVIACCRQLNIPKLVYTSSPSVVYDGKGIEGGNE